GDRVFAGPRYRVRALAARLRCALAAARAAARTGTTARAAAARAASARARAARRAAFACLRRDRLDDEDRTGRVERPPHGQHVDLAVRPFDDVAHARADLGQHALLVPEPALRVDDEANEPGFDLAARHRRHQHVALPGREQVAAIDDDVAGVAAARPPRDGIDVAVDLARAERFRLVVVVLAVGDEHPAVVLAGLDDVDLVA